MDIFKQQIEQAIIGMSFPGMDRQLVVGRILASAEEFVLSNIAADLLSQDDKALFRDCYLSAPDIFDVDEFLAERVPNYDTEVDRYFAQWLTSFRQSL